MDKQVYGKLTSDDKELLASLWETKVIKSIIRAGDIYQQDKALHIALTADSYENVLLNRGNIAGARFLYDLIKYAHEKKAE